jgi:hypothetical protein
VLSIAHRRLVPEGAAASGRSGSSRSSVEAGRPHMALSYAFRRLPIDERTPAVLAAEP